MIGAGIGNDVAAALRAQCTNVDAVEIDPAIASLGSQLGSNILGGLFGGALEALSIFFGAKAMALLAIAVYGAAAFSNQRQASEALPELVTASQSAE